MNGESITKWKKMGKNGNKKRQLGNKLKKKRIREMKKKKNEFRKGRSFTKWNTRHREEKRNLN